MKMNPLLLAAAALLLSSISPALAAQETNLAPMPAHSSGAQEVKLPPTSGHSLGSVTGGHLGKAQTVIESKCISCHSAKVIEDAIAAGKNMQEIQKRMEQKGVKLSGNDRTVLGVFWHQTPLKKR